MKENEEWKISEQVFIHSVTFIDVCLLDEVILLCNLYTTYTLYIAIGIGWNM